MIHQFKYFFFFLLCFSFIKNSYCQLIQPENKAFETTYPSKDSIYVNSKPGQIVMNTKSPLSGISRFTLVRLNVNTMIFSDTLKNNVSLLDTVLLSQNKCYELKVRNNQGDSISFRVWLLYVNPDSAYIELEKDANNDLFYYHHTCDYIDFHVAKRYFPEPKYYQPNDFSKTQYVVSEEFKVGSEVKRKLKYEIVSDYPDETILVLDEEKKKGIMRHNAPPPVNTMYILKVTSNFGYEKRDTVFYKSIVPKAMFTVKVDKSSKVPAEIDSVNSAPSVVIFSNKSKGGSIVKYTYDWGDGLSLAPYKHKIASTGITIDSCHVYQFPSDTIKGYRIRLTVESEQGCIDSTQISEIDGNDDGMAKYIIVRPPKIDEPKFPNVFTPGASENNRFRLIKNISIGNYNITIFSRWGTVVYKKNGPVLLDWEGWDGKHWKNSAESPDGLYYYVLEVLPQEQTFDAKKWKSKYSGFFYLFRANK